MDKLIILFCVIIVFVIFFSCAFYKRHENRRNYERAIEYIQNKEYDKAIFILESLADYKDAKEVIIETKKEKVYNDGIILFNQNNYKQSINKFEKIKDFKNSNGYLLLSKYNYGIELYKLHQYDNARYIFLELKDYLDSNLYEIRCNLYLIKHSKYLLYNAACKNFNNKNYKDALLDFILLDDYENSKKYIKKCNKNINKGIYN